MKVNIANIAATYVLDFRPAWRMTFKKYVPKRWFKSEVKEGVYHDWYYESYIGTIEEFKLKHPNYTVIDEIVYEKPRVFLKLNDGSKYEIHCETVQDAKAKEKEITSQKDGWLDI